MSDVRDRVLLTRPEAGAAATAARLAARGFVPVIAPLARIERLAAKLPNPAGVQAMIVTSSNALTAVPPAWRTLPLFAVGDATASRARALGFASVASASGDAGDLACLIGRSA
ncbi:MAG: uroporphyrinogen-III synthase, partial [Acetobacteraceae bacterium]|nr:uroporphyrinogen-III synthase [Acetobacteraceae bacterium]